MQKSHVLPREALMSLYQSFLKAEREALATSRPDLTAANRLQMARKKPVAQNLFTSQPAPRIQFVVELLI